MTKVLVVDDEPKMRELLVRWLTPVGYEIAEAGDAVSALEIVRTSGADVVLCDVQMPGHDGLWLLHQIRAEFPAVAVVLATAVNQIPGSVTLKDGVIAYLLKPFTTASVKKAVTDAIQWQQAAKERAARAAP